MGIKLKTNEQVKLEVNIHWSNYIFPGLIAFIGVLAAIGSIINRDFGATGFCLLMTLPLGVALLKNKCKSYIVTNQRVYVEEGILSKKRLDIPLNKINDIQSSQKIIQRMFGAGDVSIFTGNSIPIQVKGIDKPEELKNQISNELQLASTAA